MKPLLIPAIVLLCSFCYAQTINIPDKNFERALIEEGIDSDETINGKVLISDVQAITFLDLFNKKIKSLKGIEAFISLTYLDCRKNYLSRLDLSKNIALSTLYSDVNNEKLHQTKQVTMGWFD